MSSANHSYDRVRVDHAADKYISASPTSSDATTATNAQRREGTTAEGGCGANGRQAAAQAASATTPTGSDARGASNGSDGSGAISAVGVPPEGEKDTDAGELDSNRSYCVETAGPAETKSSISDIHRRRRVRYVARAALWGASTMRGVRQCGRMLRLDPDSGAPAADRVGIRRGQTGAGYSGLLHCGSVWACPRCSAVIAMRRSLEIGAALDQVRRTGGQAWMATLTVRHHASHSLDQVWEAVSAGWREVVGTHAWTGTKARTKRVKGKLYEYPEEQGDRDRLGIGGTIRAVEVTWGDPKEGGSGWHVHIHTVICSYRPISEAVNCRVVAGLLDIDVDDVTDVHCQFVAGGYLGYSWFRRWTKGVVKAGMPAPGSSGFDLRPVDDGGANFIGSYLQKATMDVAAKIGAEVAGGVNTKQARGRNVTPFEYLNDLVESDDIPRWFWKNPRTWDAWLEDDGLIVADMESGEVNTVSIPAHWRIWLEWEQASKGKRQILWSQRTDDDVATARQKWWNEVLDARGREQTDQEIADQEVDGGLVAEIHASTWWRHMVHRPNWLTDLLEAVERAPEGQAALAAEQWGRDHGIDIVPVLEGDVVKEIVGGHGGG